MDEDGVITRSDLRQFLGEDVNEYYIGNMIEDADDNCDGGLDLSEFTDIMMKVLKTSERN